MQPESLNNNKWYKMWKDAQSPLTREVDPNYRDQFAKEMLILIGDVAGKKVLEFCCGNGLLFENYGFDKSDYLGVDFSDSMLSVFKSNYPKVRLQQSLAEDFKINEKFDLIFSCGLIQYLTPNQLSTHISNMKNMLNSKGKIILAAIPWKTAKLSCLRNDHGTRRSILELIKLHLKGNSINRMGYWHSIRTFKKFAKKNNLNYTVYGSLHYHYRIHVVLTR
ncbi:MAG: class I SAM-dependent methyltransferase [Ignavibacteria bacterium]|nr:class I SAM-dependent methyltransferase [Ignavibacteria bacterium]